MRPLLRRLSSCLPVALLALAGPLEAQTADPAEVPAVDRIRLGDELHERLEPLAALQTFRAVLETDSARFDALWRAARESVALGMLAADPDARRARYHDAERWARHAVEVRPDAAEGHRWLAVALGRRAVDAGAREALRLAREIKAEAERVLAIDSLDAAGHHVLGEWHAQVMQRSGFTRFLARNLLGGDVLGEASWESARAHLERAVELDPNALIHRLALARVHLRTGREELAREQLQEVLDRPALEPTDPLHKQEAQELIRELG